MATRTEVLPELINLFPFLLSGGRRPFAGSLADASGVLAGPHIVIRQVLDGPPFGIDQLVEPPNLALHGFQAVALQFERVRVQALPRPLQSGAEVLQALLQP